MEGYKAFFFMKKFIVFICFLFSSITADVKKPIENKQISKNIEEKQIDTGDSFYEHLKNIDIPNDFNLPEIILGNANAPHTLIIYTSFSCPLCRKFHQNELPNLNEFVNNGLNSTLTYKRNPNSNRKKKEHK